MARTKKNTAQGKRKPTSMNELLQTHGKAPEKAPENKKVHLISQLFGDNGMSKFGTLEIDTFLKRIRAASRTELYEISAKCGIIPTDDRQRLEKKLVSEFNRHVSNFTMPQEKKRSAKQEAKLKEFLKTF